MREKNKISNGKEENFSANQDFEQNINIKIANKKKVASTIEIDSGNNSVLANGGVAETVLIENQTKKKFKPTNYATLTTHTIYNATSIFISTFLISYIYSISTNYLFDIGMFYLFTYIVMGIFYLLLSYILDKTNRIILYKISILIRGAFLLLIILLGRKLAQYVILAGAIFGLSEAFYWTSYNVMKNELCPRSIMHKYISIQQILEKFVKVIVPIIFGKLIDADSFKTSAIIVLCVICVQFLASFFIKSKRPENSSFNLREFRQDIKNLGEKNKALKLIFFTTIFYGVTSAISPINTVLIMISFGSNFSLGILTSIFSFFSMVLIFVLDKFTKPGKHNFINISAAVLTISTAVIAAIITNKITIIIYTFVFTALSVVYSYYYDVYRNVVIKKFNLYQDIAEFQFLIEELLEIARVVIFSIIAIAGLVGASFGASGLLVTTKIMFCLSVLSVFVMDILLVFVEKRFIKYEILS